MRSTMQGGQLGLPLLLRHAHRVNGKSKIVTQRERGRTTVTFAQAVERAGRLGSALAKRGYGRDAIIGTVGGATQEHLEAYLGVPASGRVLHTVNARLHDDQLEYIARDAKDAVFIVDAPYLERFRAVAARLPDLRLLVVVGEAATQSQPGAGYAVVAYEELLREGDPIVEWPDVDERDAAILCYTSGTTGPPKGVAYSHRSVWLQAMSMCTVNALGVGATSRLLQGVPLYHVNGWGLPFAALMAGAQLVFPGHSMHADTLLALVDDERPTIAAGVPTIWSDVLQLARARGRRELGSLRAIYCGGSQVPRVLYEAYRELGVEMIQAWGMTETSAVSTVAGLPPWAETLEEQAPYFLSQGRVVCGLEVRVAARDRDEILPSDGATVGEIEIRGPWVTASYLGTEGRNVLHDGWLRTGDLGTLDPDGYLNLVDRSKDAIKSGGEWIPSLALEEAIRKHPAVQDAAVVAIPDPRWQERPGAIVVLKEGQQVAPEELAAWLEGKVAHFWIPSFWAFSATLPQTAVGKIDKKRIRQLIREGGYS
ncbi:long-chain-fatty-acid--CoA ligase [bacterium]|nr:MAG: long-chain-fatty-acid--CoA ligase [bacterium]